MKESTFKNPGMVLLLAVFTTFLWGSAFPFVKIGYGLFHINEIDLFGKILFAGYRFVLAGVLVIFVSFLLNKSISFPKKSEAKGILLIGFVQTTMQYAFFYIGLAYTSGVKGSILYSANTFIAVLLAHFFYQSERIDLRKGIGCLLGFSGVILISLNGEQIGSGFSFMGEGMVLLAAASFGAGALISKKAAQQGDVIAITGWQLLFGGGVLVLFGILGRGHLTTYSIPGLLMLAYLAFLSAVSFTIWTVLLKYNGVGKITVFNFMIPVFGVILSAVFLKESFFQIRILAALILVCCGIYITNKKREV